MSEDGLDSVMPALAYDSSTTKFYSGSAWLTDDYGYLVVAQEHPPALFVHVVFGTNADRAGVTTPITWASGDWLRVGNAAESYDL